MNWEQFNRDLNEAIRASELRRREFEKKESERLEMVVENLIGNHQNESPSSQKTIS